MLLITAITMLKPTITTISTSLIGIRGSRNIPYSSANVPPVSPTSTNGMDA